jgi:hypothetical protein
MMEDNLYLNARGWGVQKSVRHYGIEEDVYLFHKKDKRREED